MKTPSATASDLAAITVHVQKFKDDHNIGHLALFKDFQGDLAWEADFDKSFPSVLNVDPKEVFNAGFSSEVQAISFEDDVIIGSEVFQTGTSNDTDVIIVLDNLGAPEGGNCTPAIDTSEFKGGIDNLPDMAVKLLVTPQSHSLPLGYKATIDPEVVESGIDAEIDAVIAHLASALEEDEQLHCEIHESDCETYQAVVASSMFSDPETGDMRRTFLAHQVRSRSA